MTGAEPIVVCGRCRGGRVVECPSCSGERVGVCLESLELRACPRCRGEGMVVCARCHGEGRRAATSAELAETSPPPPPTRCGCGASYDGEQWLALHLVGVQRAPGEPSLELRNCTCGSTIAIQLSEVA